MQPLVRAFVEDVLELLDPPDPVVEFGSMQVEPGQDADLRPLFAGRDFTGTDLRDGPGVDRVEDLRQLTLADGSVGTAICLETLEHCEDPLTACRELGRVTHGVCLVSTPFLLGIHGYPNDYFRFTPAALRSMLGAGFDAVWTTGVGDPGSPLWVFGVAANDRELGQLALPRMNTAQERWNRAEGKVRIGPLQLTPRELWRTVRPQLGRIARERVRR